MNYACRLCKILIYSADVLPNEVSFLLEEVALQGTSDERQQFLEIYRPLADHLTKQYVDFVVRVLTGGSDARVDPDGNLYASSDRSFGLGEDMEFFPPAHIRGPFLYVLRKDEDQGIRLVHTLANFAVANWRRNMEGRGVRPLPVAITLPSGPREYWGDAQVYYWYRSLNCGPNSVTCALMALEVWLEEQVAGGREPLELFHKVLSQGECVAVLGLCLGVALAYPAECLEAALPIVSSPSVWKMDIRRLASDRNRPPYWDPLGGNRVIYEAVAQRDRRPQRSLEARSLAPFYVFSKNHELRDKFKQAVALFAQELPFRTQEEQRNPDVATSLREDMENFQSFGDEANYYLEETADGAQIRFRQPKHIEERNAAILAPAMQQMQWASLDVWAQKTIENGKPADGMTLSQAVHLAKTFEKPGDFSVAFEMDESLEALRLQAIAGVACAILVADLDWAREQGFVPWARGVLLAASSTPFRPGPYSDRYTVFPSHPKVSAAIGLTFLVKEGAADLEVKKRILRLIGYSQLQVTGSVFRGLQPAWSREKVLCWNALGLALSLSVCRRRYMRGWTEASEAGRASELVEAYVRRLEANSTGGLPRIKEKQGEVFIWDLALHAIHALPSAEIVKDPWEKSQILQLADDLVAWTIDQNMPSPDDPHGYRSGRPYEWNHAFLGWLALLAGNLSSEECGEHILGPLRRTWPRAACLTADLLYGYVNFRIGYIEAPSAKTQNEWKEICGSMLDSPELARSARYSHLERDVLGAVSRIIYVGFGGSLLTEAWPHAPLFLDITEKWVNVIGHHPDAFSAFLTMLNGPGWQFAPEPALRWLSGIAGASTDPDELWQKHSNGIRTAEFLQRVLSHHATELREDASALKRYSDLVDGLAKAGIALAGILQKQLEKLV